MMASDARRSRSTAVARAPLRRRSAQGSLAGAACGGNLLSRKYEYEEDIYLGLDGSATIYVNASVPALVALRGFDLDVSPRARLDRAAVRAMFESPVERMWRA